MSARAHRTTGKRLSAGDVCRERGWSEGTMLTSSKWAKPRRLRDVGPSAVELVWPGHNGGGVFVKTLPDDTTREGES